MTKFLFSFLFIFSVAYSQENSFENINSGNAARLGLKLGTVETNPSSKIGNHGIMGVLFEKDLTNKLYMSFDAEYFEKNIAYTQSYTTRVFGDKVLDKWQNLSVNAALIDRLTEKGRLGIGISSEYFIISNNKYLGAANWKKEIDYLLRAAVVGIAGLDFKLNNYFTFFLEGRYKIVFMGEGYGLTNLDALFSLMGYAGIKLDV
jgi:hypothetical protein